MSEEIYSLWIEYEECSTPEAKVVKQLDKFEMIFQANEYEVAEEDKDLQDFFDTTADVFDHSEISEWNKLLRKERDDRIARKENNDNGTQ